MALIDQRCNKLGKCPFQMSLQGTLICSLVSSTCGHLVDIESVPPMNLVELEERTMLYYENK